MSSGRLLVVEDDQSLRELLAIVLVDEGYEVEVAAGGEEALRVLERWRPDLIMLDLVMPGMDGWAFLTHQRRDGVSDIPVLILTAAGSAEAEANALSAPVISKPFQLEELLETVERLTDRQRAPQT